MSNVFKRLFQSLGLGGRDWAVLLLALLLAFSTWLIHNLSLKYNDYLTVSVTAACNIEGHADISANQCQVVARCRTTGYNVLRIGAWGVRKEKTVSFSPSVMNHLEDDIYYITSSDLMEYSHLIFGDDVTVEYYASDTLTFRFPEVRFRKVPVQPVYSLSYKPQYMCIGELHVQPDSVTLYGDAGRLENISFVYTQPLRRSDLDSDINGELPLEKIRGIRMSDAAVRYSLDVTRFVEISSRVDIKAVNVPADKEMLILPSKADVMVKCQFPIVADPLQGLSLYVDYNEFTSSLSGKCQVRADELPRGIASYSVSPSYVECIVGDK